MDSAGAGGGKLIGGGEEVDLKKMNLYGFFNTDGVSDTPLSDDDDSDKDESVKEKSDVITYEEESDFLIDDEDGYREMKPEELQEYYARVKASEGFDVPLMPNAISFGSIRAVWNLFSDEAVYCEVDECAVYALEQHNAEAKKNYTLHKIVKANMYGAAGTMYYITFKAEDLDKAGHTQNVIDQGLENVGPAGGPIVEFEAQAFLGLPDEQDNCVINVIKFRQKGSKGTGGIKSCSGCCSGRASGSGSGSGSGTSTE